MGLWSSKSASASDSSGSSKKSSSHVSTSFYAELISDKALPSELPSIKVFFNDQITSTAVDSLHDSEAVAQQLSKSLLLELLQDKKAISQFGIFLNHIFQFESLLLPTRSLIYWSLHLDPTVRATDSLVKSQASYHLAFNAELFRSTSGAVANWLLSEKTSEEVLSPLIRNTLKQDATVVGPAAKLSASSMPLAKVSDLHPLT